MPTFNKLPWKYRKANLTKKIEKKQVGTMYTSLTYDVKNTIGTLVWLYAEFDPSCDCCHFNNKDSTIESLVYDDYAEDTSLVEFYNQNNGCYVNIKLHGEHSFDEDKWLTCEVKIFMKDPYSLFSEEDLMHFQKNVLPNVTKRIEELFELREKNS